MNYTVLEKDEILEGSKVLLKFMKETPKFFNGRYAWSDSPYFSCIEDDYDKVMIGIIHYAKYHSSWDWLMPVVEKIEHNYAYVNIKGCWVTISDIVDVSAPTKIEAIFRACVEIVKHHQPKIE